MARIEFLRHTANLHFHSWVGVAIKHQNTQVLNLRVILPDLTIAGVQTTLGGVTGIHPPALRQKYFQGYRKFLCEDLEIGGELGDDL